ncbi:hypothetical protein COOONC_09553 [Cooperia oncophora]
MIICANPKPSDFEENLNVLAFAEESQAVRVARADDRLEIGDGPRPPVPRRFFSRWNIEVDNIVSPSSLLPSHNRLFTEFFIRDYNDSLSISNLKERCLALSQLTSSENHDMGVELHNGEITLRNALCVADYAKMEMDELRARIEKDAEQIASYSAENKRLKRELLSLRERLSRYEVQDEEIITAEENLRRSVKEERSRARKQDQKLKVLLPVHNGEITLRNALCVADYAKMEMDELRARIEKDAEQIASYSAENKRLKRELLSLRERLSRYEVQDEEIITAEENLRRSVKEERSRARRQDQKLKVIQDICDAPSPSFAQIRSKFSMGGETPSSAATSQHRALAASVSNQAASSSRQPRSRQVEPGTPASGPGFFNPKYHRRSKSAPRVLDHQPTNRVPTGGILRAKIPSNARHVTKPEAHQLQKSSDYILTHQEVDREGNISTSVVKKELRIHVESIKSPERASVDTTNADTFSSIESEVVYEL